MKAFITFVMLLSSVSSMANVRCDVGNEQVDKIYLNSTQNPQISDAVVVNSKNQVILRGPMIVTDTRNKSTIFVRNAWNWEIEIFQYRELLSADSLTVNGKLTTNIPNSRNNRPFSIKCVKN